MTAERGAHSDHGSASTLFDLSVVQVAEAEESFALRACARGLLVAIAAAELKLVTPSHRPLVLQVAR